MIVRRIATIAAALTIAPFPTTSTTATTAWTDQLESYHTICVIQTLPSGPRPPEICLPYPL